MNTHNRVLLIVIGGGFGLPNSSDIPDFILRAEPLKASIENNLVISFETLKNGVVNEDELQTICDLIRVQHPTSCIILHTPSWAKDNAVKLFFKLGQMPLIPITVLGPEETTDVVGGPNMLLGWIVHILASAHDAPPGMNFSPCRHVIQGITALNLLEPPKEPLPYTEYTVSPEGQSVDHFSE